MVAVGYWLKGLIILSGDLYHMRNSYRLKQIPVFNSDRSETLLSMVRIDVVLNNTHGKLIIQHDSKDFASLPKNINYLN